MAGERIDPHVSDPIAKGTKPHPTADPDPLDDPPAHVFLSQGLLQGPVIEALGCLYPIPPASSTIANFAIRTAPDFRNFETTVAS